ncbi:MAG: GMC family oxidoreductase N-terminal domain-containing protein [Pseudonocardia sp.]|nr:GMC family oxidoreductase N-terminal domain-containing protein [Pseudonocardia sp.]
MTYDIVVVGGGSAGCVLANRLSASEGRSVLLLEAGPDYRTAAELPQDIAASAYAPQSHDWGYVAEPDTLGNEVAVPRGKVIGGSSSTNYCFAMRARPADHAAWVELGNPGWGYEDVLPLYRAMESYPHGRDEWHGRDGEYRITRDDWDGLAPTAAASTKAAVALGYATVDDVNVPGPPGFSLAPLSTDNGVRQSTALTYLNPVRGRDNLEVRGDTAVDRVLFDTGRAVGVRLSSGEEILAGTVILSAGTYNTPAILMRSGVGPAGHLAELGVELVRDLPGVGANLTEHPVMWNIHAARPPEGEISAMFQTALSVRCDPGDPDYDLHVLPTAAVPTEALPPSFVPPVSQHPTGWDMIFFVACVQPRSRGTVRLRSIDPTDPPVIDLGLYTHPDDAPRVAEAVRIARRLAATPPLSELLVGERTPGPDVGDEELADAVRRAPSHYNHACGTARMGPEADSGAVVGSDCRVHGLDGLAVVDASVMPTIPRVPTNPTTILIAERASRLLAEPG